MTWIDRPPSSGLYWFAPEDGDEPELYSVFIGAYSSCVWVGNNASTGLDEFKGKWWSEPAIPPPTGDQT